MNWYKPVRSILQIDEIDNSLRNKLWNILDIYFWHDLRQMSTIYFYKDMYPGHPKLSLVWFLVKALWSNYFGRRIDEFPNQASSHFNFIKDYFLQCQWNEVYDFIEFVANNCHHIELANKFRQVCNDICQRNLSAYRFVDGLISPIVAEIEINEIEEAISYKDRYEPVSEHLKRALELLSDRKSPDYRNSIKESISAVEALCILIVGRDKAKTLGEALNTIQKQGNLGLSPVLKQAFDKMYGYTNSEGGIRHALLDDANSDAEEAKFMLRAPLIIGRKRGREGKDR